VKFDHLLVVPRPIMVELYIQSPLRLLGVMLDNNFRLKSGNACYYSLENLLSSRLLSRNVKIRIYKTIILPVVLYGCETWSVTLKEEHRVRVFEKRVLRKVFGSKRSEVTGGCEKLHNEELHNLYSSPSIIRMIKSRRMI
jgi:hypothetical protein